MRNNLILILSLAAFGLLGCQQNRENLSPVDISSMAYAPQVMQVRIQNYRPQSGNVLQNIFVSNFSVKASHGQLEWSSARDGLSDQLKNSTLPTYGFSPDSPESAVSGFADLILFNAGINLSQQNLMYCSPNQMRSTSNDVIIYNDNRYNGAPETHLGLRDCEKSYIGLNPNSFDHNNNGIPDYLEIRCGLNPQNKSQAFVSTAGDGVANIDKCKMNIPLDESAKNYANQLFAYQYAQTTDPDGSMTFNISNIPILQNGQDNLLVFYITETNPTNRETSLYTAYAVLKDGYNGKTLQFDYWATSSASFFNQQVLVP